MYIHHESSDQGKPQNNTTQWATDSRERYMRIYNDLACCWIPEVVSSCGLSKRAEGDGYHRVDNVNEKQRR